MSADKEEKTEEEIMWKKLSTLPPMSLVDDAIIIYKCVRLPEKNIHYFGDNNVS